MLHAQCHTRASTETLVCRLAELLDFEEMQFQGELSQIEETMEERQSRMADRARELIRKREEERSEFAAEMKEKKWRDSCDIFRAVDSHAFLMKCVSDRGQQLVEKQQQKEKALSGTHLLVMNRSLTDGC